MAERVIGDNAVMSMIFSHANGYPPGSYRALIAQLEALTGQTILPFEHRPLTSQEPAPNTLSWQVFASDLIEAIELNGSEPVWLVGHSMGAAAGILAAARRPDLFRGIVALDPVLIPTLTWLQARFFSRFSAKAMPLAARALSRPHWFESVDVAFSFYRGKRVFAGVEDGVLRDYVAAAHNENVGGGVDLRFSGAWEACIYRSVPRVGPALKRLQCPCLVVAGSTSDVLTAKRLDWIRRNRPDIDIETLIGGHLIPLESPETCAETAARYIALHAKQ